MLPLVTIMADLLAILAESWWRRLTLTSAPSCFSKGSAPFSKPRMSSRPHQGSRVLFVIAHMGCYHGMRTTGGAEGVGLATTRAVVSACVLILVNDYLLAELLFRVVFA